MMKSIILTMALVVVATIASAQVSILNDKVDEFTGVRRVLTTSVRIERLVLSASIAIDEEKGYEIAWINGYPMDDLGCGGASGNYIMFLFDDGTTLKLDFDMLDIDCGRSPQSAYDVTSSLEDLTTKTITKIRFKQSDYHKDYEVKDPQNLMNMFKLISR